jgi:MGT family glycosyltransferase
VSYKLERGTDMAQFCVFTLGFQGHINPVLPVVQELISRGHRVQHYSTEAFREEISRAGAEFCRYRSTFEAGFVFPKVKAGKASPYLLRSLIEASHVLAQIQEAVAVTMPDAILYDGACLTGRLLGEILKVPTIKLCPSYASTEDYSPFEESRKLVFEDPEMVLAIRAEASKIHAQYGVGASLGEPTNHAESLNVVFMPKVFHPEVTRFDERFMFVGPSLPLVSEPTHSHTADRKPLLYISMGTLNNDLPEFFRMCGDSFSDWDWDIVMAVGHRVDPIIQKNLPANFQARPYFPQLEILRAADVFISQGGMNSVQESLHFGVPLVVLPTTPEQALTANRVESLGLGVTRDLDNLTPSQLQTAVQEVRTDPKFAKNLREMTHISRESGGFKAAADRILAFLSW